METTKYDEKMKRMKNNRLIVWGLILFGVIVGASQLLDSGANILKKLVNNNDDPKKDSTEESIIVQPSSPSVIIMPSESDVKEERSLPAKIDVIQFTINSDSCFFASKTLKDGMIEVYTNVDNLEDTILMIENKIEENNGRETKKFNRNKYNPLIDVTVFNSGEEKTVFTSIQVNVIDISIAEGDGSFSVGSHIIKVLNIYNITLPNFIELYPDKTFLGKTKLNHLIEFPTIPPVLIDSNDAARFQIALNTKLGAGAQYNLAIDFVFSNGQKITKKVFIEF